MSDQTTGNEVPEEAVWAAEREYAKPEGNSAHFRLRRALAAALPSIETSMRERLTSGPVLSRLHLLLDTHPDDDESIDEVEHMAGELAIALDPARWEKCDRCKGAGYLGGVSPVDGPGDGDCPKCGGSGEQRIATTALSGGEEADRA